MRRILLPLFLFYLLPNIFFLLICYWTGDDRPLINIDYLFPLLCFTFKNRVIKVLGVILFIAFFGVDVLLIVLQHFPNLHLRDMLYLLSFLFSGPKMFLVYGCIVIFVMVLEIIISWFGLKKISFLNLLVIGLCILPLNTAYFLLNKDNHLNFYFYNNPLFGSNSLFFFKNRESNFSSLSLLKATPYRQATRPWSDAISAKKPLNQKLLLIIVESWGHPLNEAIQQDILKNLKAKANEFDFFSQGSIPFRGITVEGELRELCQLQPETIDIVQIRTGFQNCLPHLLNDLGYETRSLHGGSSTIYGRKIWYPKAGFQTGLFQEDFKLSSKCIPFDGACDWDILPFLKQSFAQDKKLFNYWLTLTSHYNYDIKDIHNKRFDCDTYHIPEDGDACHNFMHQAQLFDNLADFISAPEMKGVEVIIVGDHPPPLFKSDEINLFKTKEMTDDHIGWVHFKIKNAPNHQ